MAPKHLVEIISPSMLKFPVLSKFCCLNHKLSYQLVAILVVCYDFQSPNRSACLGQKDGIHDLWSSQTVNIEKPGLMTKSQLKKADLIQVFDHGTMGKSAKNLLDVILYIYIKWVRLITSISLSLMVMNGIRYHIII